MFRKNKNKKTDAWERIDKKPWTVTLEGYIDEIKDQNGVIVGFGFDKDDAKRITALYNACQGISIEAIEKGVIAFAVDWLRGVDLVTGLPREINVPVEEAEFMGVRIWDPGTK